MKIGMRTALVGVAPLVVIFVGLVLIRNHELDSGAAALKVGNGSAAIRRLNPLANLGDNTAQTLLGYAYAYGWAGIAKNDDEAMYWFSRKGVFGSRGPQDGSGSGALEALNVANAYATGSEGVQVDLTESQKWLRLAARAGSKEAITALSNHR